MMNFKKIIFVISLIFASINISATEQRADILIIENDTIFLKTYPFEILDLKHEFTSPHTACWRGYQAVWRIVENKLYLEKLLDCDKNLPFIGNRTIFDFFEKNGLKYQEKNGMIFADWYTADLFKLKSPLYRNSKNIYLYDGADKKQKDEKEVLLQIKNGIVKRNRLK